MNLAASFGSSLFYEFSVKNCCPLLTTLVSGSPIIQDGKLVGAVTHVILLCGASVPLGAMHFARPKTSHRGAICARSLVSKLTDSLRLIMCSKSN